MNIVGCALYSYTKPKKFPVWEICHIYRVYCTFIGWFWFLSKGEQKVVAVGWWDGGSLDFLPCSATFNLHPLYLCSYPVFVCSGESYLCKIGRQYFSRQQRRITPEVPSDSLRFLEDCDNKDGSKQKSKRNYKIETLSNCFFFVKSDKFPNSRICQLW